MDRVEPTGQVCATCGAKLVAEKQAPSPVARAIGTGLAILTAVFLAGFVWQAIQYSWGL
jgi:hypothetical protein